MKKDKHLTVSYFTKNFSIVVGLVLIWRGIWYILDSVDLNFFGQNHFWTAFGGIILGLIILYIPDKDLKEIERL